MTPTDELRRVTRSQPGISVGTPTYKRRDVLMLVIPPLLRDAAHETIVVNDGPSDGSVNVLEDMRAGDRASHCTTWPIEGGKGVRRAGMEAATGDIVVLLDDDVRPVAD